MSVRAFTLTAEQIARLAAEFPVNESERVFVDIEMFEEGDYPLENPGGDITASLHEECLENPALPKENYPLTDEILVINSYGET